MVKQIPLTRGQHALVDDQDFEWLDQFKWCAQYEKFIDGFYAKTDKYLGKDGRKTKKKTILMHRIILEKMVGHKLKRSELTDHINHDPLDNRRENLRMVTNRQNQQNRKRKGRSQYTGVSWNKRCDKWVAEIRLNGKHVYLGLFVNEKDAAKAYEQACREFVGEELVCKAHKVKELI